MRSRFIASFGQKNLDPKYLGGRFFPLESHGSFPMRNLMGRLVPSGCKLVRCFSYNDNQLITETHILGTLEPQLPLQLVTRYYPLVPGNPPFSLDFLPFSPCFAVTRLRRAASEYGPIPMGERDPLGPEGHGPRGQAARF